jgi:hypothetical protein
MKMCFWSFEHLVAQLTNCSKVPLYSMAFPKLNIQNENECKASLSPARPSIETLGYLQPVHHPLF